VIPGALHVGRTQGLDRMGCMTDPESLDGGNVLFNTVLFTGNANPSLAQEIATHLGIELGKAKVGRFSDGEVDIEIQQNVRARDIFVVQPTCAPTNENLMELCIMVDALKRASARRVTAVIPYFGYARQDRRPRSTRVPISAKVVANMLEAVGVERLLTMDVALPPKVYQDVPRAERTLESITERIGGLPGVESAAAFDLLTRSSQDDEMVQQNKDRWPNTFRTSRFVPAVEYLNACRMRVRLRLSTSY